MVVAAPADDAPVLRLRAARLATSIASRLRASGKHVLLVLDSLTRVAQAQREIGLAVGEPPTTKGYPPSVFALLPRLVEQAGAVERHSGSITAFYTVLAEGDDQNDPIADAARAILDGHIVLSRRLADAGHYPAIDVGGSISRVMPKLIDAERMKLAQRFRELWVRYAEQEDLISVGAYAAGSDRETDRAIQLRADMQAFLEAERERAGELDSSWSIALARVIKPNGPEAGRADGAGVEMFEKPRKPQRGPSAGCISLTETAATERARLEDRTVIVRGEYRRISGQRHRGGHQELRLSCTSRALHVEQSGRWPAPRIRAPLDTASGKPGAGFQHLTEGMRQAGAQRGEARAGRAQADGRVVAAVAA